MLDQDQDYLTASSEIILILITKNLIYTNLESIFFFLFREAVQGCYTWRSVYSSQEVLLSLLDQL